MRGVRVWVVLTLLLLPMSAVAHGQNRAVPSPSALAAAGTGGIEVVDRALAKLSQHRRMLVIGAHPDDEDTSSLTLVARSMGGEAAYLALSRGDGGQNLIGSELGVGLGAIRTQELVAARRVDGARQYFTRAFDFGYTRSLDETLHRWPSETLLTDVARVVWRFRPQVIVSVFPNDGRGGHGQHQAAGWVAHEIFDVAADEERFADLIGEGWLPWQPSALFRPTWWDPDNATLEESLGRIDPLSGQSMLQIAMRSRSQHRSQDMGTLQPLGTRNAAMAWVAGGGGPESESLFSGIDTRLAAIAANLPAGEVRGAVEAALGRAESLARTARAQLSPVDLGAVVPALTEVHVALTEAREWSTASTDPMAGRIATELITEKLAVAEAGLAAAAGVALEATLAAEAVAPGDTTELRALLWNSGMAQVELDRVEIVASPGWRIEAGDGAAGSLEPGEIGEWVFAAAVRDGAMPSMPYYLARERQGDLYDWSSVPAQWRGLPQQPPELTARFHVTVAGRELRLEREVVFRLRDQARGEVRRPVRIVPPVEITVEPSLALWVPDKTDGVEVNLTLRSHRREALDGTIEVELPKGWTADTPAFEIGEGGGEVTVPVTIRAPETLDRGEETIRFSARLGTSSLGLAVPLLEFEHIRPTPLPTRADLRVSIFPVALPDVGVVGYVRGASDRVPEFLAQVGVDVELLTAQGLARGDLSRFQVIVIGSRAYETDPALVAANRRVLEFARAGGLVIVQYQQYQYTRGGFAPFAVEINRPHDRITDETAPVRLLDVTHPVFNKPNVIEDRDWEGWVQERGLYFAGSWDEAWTPLLAMQDPGMEPQSGGLLVAPVGEGLYVYTGLAFFRQLPAGVAGGYRFLANLLALGEHSEGTVP